MNDEIKQWRDLVGGFILAFGDIELITYRLWQNHFGDEQPIHKFGSRTEKIINKLNDDVSKNSELIKLLERALAISHKRNTIAHNPMQVQVFEHTKTGEILIELGITSVRNKNEYIDDAELKELLAEAEFMVSSLYMKLGFLEPKPRPRDS